MSIDRHRFHEFSLSNWSAFWDESKRRQADYRRQKQERRAGRPMPSACEICEANKERLHWDHCHKTGKFRGWICNKCNTALGMLGDSADRLQKALDYLRAAEGLTNGNERGTRK